MQQSQSRPARREKMIGDSLPHSKDDDSIRLLLDSVPALISYVDSDFRYRCCNRAYSEWFGLTPDEVKGRTMCEVVGDMVWETLRPCLLTALHGEVANFEGEVKYLHGGSRWISAKYTPHKNDDGTVLGIIGMVSDISARKKAERGLRESEKRFRSFVEATAHVIWRTNAKGEVDQPVPSWNAFTGQTDEEAAGYGWMNVIHRDDLSRVKAAWESAGATKTLYEVEYRLKIHSGEWRRVLARGVPVIADGQIIEYIGTCMDVTDRRLAEEGLHRTEARLSTVLDHLTEGVLVATQEANIIFWNAAGLKIYGYGSLQEAQRNLADFANTFRFTTLDGQELAYEQWPLNRVLRGDELGGYELQLKRLDQGWEKILCCSGAMVETAAGERVASLSFVDRTKQRTAEAAVRESEGRFRAVADNIPQLAWMTDPDGWIVWYNKRWFEYTGTTLEQMQGWGWKAVHHPEHTERVTVGWVKALKAGIPWEDTFPLRSKNGDFRWFLSRAFPIRDANGKIVRWFGTNTDITELRDAQARLSDREAVLRTVTNEARVGLVMVDKQRRYLFANQTYMEILGLGDRDIVGQRVGDVLSHVYDQIKPQLDLAFTGKRLTYELRLAVHPRTHDERFYEVVYEPRIENQDEPYVVVVIVDITDRKKALENLERTVQERTAALKDSNEQLEAFTYSVAHDLRAPLRSQQGFANALIEDYGHLLDETGHEYARKIIASATRLNDLVGDLLAFSRISRTEMKLEKIELRKTVLEISDELSFQLQEAQATIQVEPFQDRVCGHSVTLKTAITNLLSNALKFTRPGVPPHIRLWSERRDKFVRLWVEDNGIGIAPEYHHQIFGVFHRLHKSGEYPGTGVGLAIVQKGIERMGGRVGVESKRGAGSRFWLELETPD